MNTVKNYTSQNYRKTQEEKKAALNAGRTGLVDLLRVVSLNSESGIQTRPYFLVLENLTHIKLLNLTQSQIAGQTLSKNPTLTESA